MLPEKLQAARLKLVRQRPYLAAALWAAVPVERPGLGTLAVDRWWRLYFDPAALDRWSTDQLAGALYHEVCHLLRDHPARFEWSDPRLSNMATDVAINDDILAEGVALPGQPLTPARFGLPENLLEEEYYDLLKKAGQPTGAGGEGRPGDPDGRPGAPSGAEDGDAAGVDADARHDPGAAAGGRSPTGGESGAGGSSGSPSPVSDGRPDRSPPEGHSSGAAPGAGRCGSCAAGRPEPWEEPDPGTPGAAPGVSAAEAELIRREVARQILEASREQGDVPGHWRRWAEEKLSPRVDWRRELASAVRSAAAAASLAADYTFRRPSRRSAPGVILPGLQQPIPEVAVVVDTSGSMSDRQIAQALAEIAGVLRTLGSRAGVRVLAVDAAVQTCRRVFRPEQIELRGGGGTDMGAGLEAAVRPQAGRPRPEVVVVITDGHTPWPERPPEGARVIVALVGDGNSPAWAKTVKVGV